MKEYRKDYTKLPGGPLCPPLRVPWRGYIDSSSYYRMFYRPGEGDVSYKSLSNPYNSPLDNLKGLGFRV